MSWALELMERIKSVKWVTLQWINRILRHRFRTVQSGNQCYVYQRAHNKWHISKSKKKEREKRKRKKERKKKEKKKKKKQSPLEIRKTIMFEQELDNWCMISFTELWSITWILMTALSTNKLTAIAFDYFFFQTLKNQYLNSTSHCHIQRGTGQLQPHPRFFSFLFLSFFLSFFLFFFQRVEVFITLEMYTYT